MTSQAQPQAAPDDAACPHVVRLPNGLTLLVQEDHRFPLVSLRLYVPSGSALEDPDQAGISHLLEHMAFKGAERRGPGRAAKDIESAGGYINAATSFEYTVYLADMPADKWTLGLDVLQDMVFHPSLDSGDLEREKGVVLAELERNEDTAGPRLFKTVQSLAWDNTPYARPIIGQRETVQSISGKALKEYVRHFHQPQSVLLVICGQISVQEALAETEKLFSGLKNDRGVHPPLPLDLETYAAESPGPKIHLEFSAWNKAYMAMAFPIPGSESAEVAGLDVLARLLGGDSTSRLYRKFKYERQLVDEISATAITLRRVGMLYIQAALDPANLDVFWLGLVEELAGLSDAGFSKKELERAKLNLEDSLFQAKETLSGLASKLGYFQFFENGPASEENHLFHLRSVDQALVNKLIENYLNPERLSCVMLLPEELDPATLPDPDTLPESVPFSTTTLETVVTELWPSPPARTRRGKRGAKSGPETVDLGNGRSLVLIPDPTLPYTSLDITFRGGDSLLTPDEQGLARLCAQSLTRGAGKLNAIEVQDFLSDRAARVSAGSNRDTFSLSAKYPTRFAPDVHGLIRDVLAKPAFAPEEVDRAVKNQLASIKSREDKPLGLAFRQLFPFLFQNHSYGYYHQGLPEDLKSYTPDQVADFWERQRRMPWAMAVCGDFDRKRITALAKSLANNEVKDLEWPGPPPDWNQERNLDLTLAGRNQTHLLLTFKGVSLDHPDTPGLTLLRVILAGQGGLLFEHLRDDQALCYQVTAMLWQSLRAGLLAFYIGTYPDKAEAALQGFRTVAESLRQTPPDPAQVERGKLLMEGNYHRDHQSLASRSNEAAILQAQGLDLDMNRILLSQAASLTPEDLQWLAKKYLTMDEAWLMRVVP